MVVPFCGTPVSVGEMGERDRLAGTAGLSFSRANPSRDQKLQPSRSMMVGGPGGS